MKPIFDFIYENILTKKRIVSYIQTYVANNAQSAIATLHQTWSWIHDWWIGRGFPNVSDLAPLYFLRPFYRIIQDIVIQTTCRLKDTLVLCNINGVLTYEQLMLNYLQNFVFVNENYTLKNWHRAEILWFSLNT